MYYYQTAAFPATETTDGAINAPPSVVVLFLLWLIVLLQTLATGPRYRSAPRSDSNRKPGTVAGKFEQLSPKLLEQFDQFEQLIAEVNSTEEQPVPSAEPIAAEETTDSDEVEGSQLSLEDRVRQELGHTEKQWQSAKSTRGPQPYYPITLDDQQLELLIAVVRSCRKYSPEQQKWSRIILMAAAGLSNSGIERLLGPARNTVIAWRKRFLKDGMKAIIPPKPLESKTVDEQSEFQLPPDMVDRIEGKEVRDLIRTDGLLGFLNIPLVQHTAETLAEISSIPEPTSIDSSEERARDKGREHIRLALQEQIDRWAPWDLGPKIKYNGRIYSRCSEIADRILDTTVGRIVIRRTTYRCKGVKKAIVPFDELLNLPKGEKSPLLIKYEIRQAALDPYDSARKTVEQHTGAHVAKRTVETMMAESSVDFEDFYAARQADPAREKELIIFNIDRKGILLTKKEQQRLNLKLKEPDPNDKRRSPGRPTGKKMAVVATVHSSSRYLRSPDDVMKELKRTPGSGPRPPKPHNKRIWASLEKSLNEQVRAAYEEMIKRDPGKEKEWAMLMDGEMALRDQIREVFGPKLAARFTEILDFFHVLEYLWAVANAAHRKGKHKREKAQQMVSRYARMLLEGQVKSVITLLHLMVDSKKVSAQLRKAVKDCTGYFEARIPMMRYDLFLARGYPIASGVVEGACKNLVKCRFERSGMMWEVAGAEAVLQVRSVVLNSDLDQYWNYHREQEKTRLYGSKTWQTVGHSASGGRDHRPVQALC